eukprot:4313880-Pleurochrysis_carterae.AAC.1
MSLPAVRLYLAGLPPEPSIGPLDVHPISEAWSHALRDLVHSSAGSVVSYLSARKEVRFAESDEEERARTQAGLRLK